MLPFAILDFRFHILDFGLPRCGQSKIQNMSASEDALRATKIDSWACGGEQRIDFLTGLVEGLLGCLLFGVYTLRGVVDGLFDLLVVDAAVVVRCAIGRRAVEDRGDLVFNSGA